MDHELGDIRLLPPVNDRQDIMVFALGDQRLDELQAFSVFGCEFTVRTTLPALRRREFPGHFRVLISHERSPGTPASKIRRHTLLMPPRTMPQLAD